MDVFIPNLAAPLPPFMHAMMDRVMNRPPRRAPMAGPVTPAQKVQPLRVYTPTSGPQGLDSHDGVPPKRLKYTEE